MLVLGWIRVSCRTPKEKTITFPHNTPLQTYNSHPSRCLGSRLGRSRRSRLDRFRVIFGLKVHLKNVEFVCWFVKISGSQNDKNALFWSQSSRLQAFPGQKCNNLSSNIWLLCRVVNVADDNNNNNNKSSPQV